MLLADRMRFLLWSFLFCFGDDLKCLCLLTKCVFISLVKFRQLSDHLSVNSCSFGVPYALVVLVPILVSTRPDF